MEHLQHAIESVEEQSKMGTAVKTEIETAATSTAHIDSEVDLNYLKQEPGIVQTVKSEPALLVKEEILEDTSQDGNEQQCAKGTLTPADAGSRNEACGTNLGALLQVKQELEDIDIGPTVLQHMDIHYTMNKNMSAVMEENAIVDDCNEVMPDGAVKESAEDKLIGSITTQNATMDEQNSSSTLQNPQLADQLESICCVNLIRLDTFQCDLCDAAYAEKRWLLQHVKRHGSSLQTSLFLNFRKANKHQSATDNQIKTCKGLTTTRVDYDKVHLTSSLVQQKNLQQRHHRASSSNGFKCNSCDRTFHKPHLLSAHKKMHAQNSMTSVTTSSAVANPPNASRDETAKAKQKPFKCYVCKKGYTSKTSLNAHKRLHSTVGLVVCHICNVQFYNKSHLTNHLLTHTGEKPFQCTTCGARFTQSGSLTMHMRVHKGEKPFECDTCDARFVDSSSLTKHTRVHTGEKPYQCDTCGARFADSSTLTKHTRIHTGKKPYQCDTCNARFAESSALTKHTRIHTGEKPFKCTMCDKRFAQSGVLTRHIRVHTGEKPYKCSTCDARFTLSCALTVHKRVHTGEKPFQCTTCDARFADRSVLVKHMRVHTGEKPYLCPTSDGRFANSRRLTTHISIHTG